MRTAARWALRLLIGVTALLLLLVVTLLVGIRSGAGRDLLRREAATRIGRLLHADIEVRAIGGSLLGTLVLEDVRVVVDGRMVIRVPRLEASYALRTLLGGDLHVERVVVTRPRVRLVQKNGRWVFPRPTPDDDEREHHSRLDLGVWIEHAVIEDGRFDLALLDAQPPRRLGARRVAAEGSTLIRRELQTFEVDRLGFAPRGLRLPHVDATGSGWVERGHTVRVSHLELATRHSRVRAAGTITPDEYIDARAAATPLAATDIRRLAPRSGVVADVRADVRARGPWQAIAAVARATVPRGGAVAGRGTLDAVATPLAWATRLRVAELDPSTVVTRGPHASLQGSVQLAARGFELHGPLRYALALHDSRVEGREIQRLNLAGRADAGVHRVRADVVAPLGKAALRARLGLDPPQPYRAKARYTVARLDQLVPSTWGWAMGEANLRGHGTTPDARRARLAVAVNGASVHGLPVNHAALRARLDASALELAHLVLDAPELHLEGGGHADVERRTGDLTMNGRADLGTVGAYLGQRLAGRATVALAGRGAASNFGAEGDLTLEQPAYDRVSAGPTTARVRLRGLGGASPGGDAHVEAADLRVGTDVPYATHADVGWGRQGREDRADVTAEAKADGGRVQKIALTVVRTPERARGELRELTVSPTQGPVWQLSAPARFTLDETLAIDRLALEGRDQHLTVTGRLGLRSGQSDASAVLDSIRLTPLCVMAGLPPCAGRLNGRLGLRGTASAPVVDLSAHGTRLRVREVDYGELDVSARAAETRATVAATLSHPQAGEVHVEGAVPLDLAWGRPRRDLSQAPVALTATATHLDLTVVSSLGPRRVESSAGRLSFNLRADGPWRAPRIVGDLGIDDGRLELLAVGIPYEKIHARLFANGTRVEVRELHAEAGDGSADLTGTVDLPIGGAGAADLTLQLDEFFAVRREAYEAAVSGAITLRGALDAPEVSGTLDVERALVRPAGLPASEPTVVKDPTIEVVGALTPPEEEAASATTPPTQLAEPVRLALTVTIARNAWIRRDDADIEIAGELKLTKAPWEPVKITGQIRLVRGWYMFKGRRFTLQQGTITFAGGAPPVPSFDITAVYRSGEYEIQIHVSGSADKPALELSSNPSLEQADILSVLLFGKPAAQLGRGQSTALQDQALQLAAGYVVPELRTSVMNVLGVDTLDVELPQGTEQTGRVSAGRYVVEDVFLSLAQELGPRAAQEVGVEYSVGANVSVRGSTTTRGTSAIDLLWHYRY